MKMLRATGLAVIGSCFVLASLATAQQTQVPATPNQASSCERFERRGEGFLRIGVCYAKTGQIPVGNARPACEQRMRCGFADGDCFKGLDACIGINDTRCDQGTPMERGACRAPKDLCANAPNAEERARCLDVARVWSEATGAQSSTPAVPATPDRAGDCERFPRT